MHVWLCTEVHVDNRMPAMCIILTSVFEVLILNDTFYIYFHGKAGVGNHADIVITALK